MNTNSVNENKPKYDLTTKVLVFGDSKTGKSGFLNRYCDNNSENNRLATIGIDLQTKYVENDGKTIKMQIYNMAALERSKMIARTYFRDIQGIIFVYACNSRDSFENVNQLLQRIDHLADKKVCKILIGNKFETDKQVVNYDEGKALAAAFGLEFFEIGSEDKFVVEEAFKRLALEIYQAYRPVDEKVITRIDTPKAEPVKQKGFFQSVIYKSSKAHLMSRVFI